MIAELHGISRTFRGRPPVRAVVDINVSLPQGAITVLMGPNGAGKSTLLRILCGTLRPDTGSLRLFGQPMPDARPAIRNRMGVLLGSSTGLYARLTAREQLRYSGRLRGLSDRFIEQRIEHLGSELGLASFLDRRCGGFSTGMRQRTAIACAILHEPELVILDEPFAGLDMDVRSEVAAIIRRIARDGTTLLIATHQPAELQDLATRLWILRDGHSVVWKTVEAGELLTVLAGDHGGQREASGAASGEGNGSATRENSRS